MSEQEVQNRQINSAGFHWHLSTLKSWILGMLCLRIIFLVFSPLDLIADEAYYWDWSRQLDWCYFSKPPMIAWVIRLTSELTGGSVMALRGAALILATLSAWFIYDLARMMYGEKTGLLAAVLLMLTPGHIAQSTLITIDAPFLCCFCGALWATWKWSLSPGVNLNLLMMLGFIFCGILSKQTMCGFLPLLCMFLLVTPELRKQIFSWSSVLAIATGVAGIVPIIAWNSRHHWVTFQHTASHFQVEKDASGWGKILAQHAGWFLEFQASQFFLLSPFIWVGICLITLEVFRRYQKLERREIYLVCFSIIPLLGVGIMSMRQRLEPNWGAAFYPAGVILFTAIFNGQTLLNERFHFSESFRNWSLRTGIISTCLCYFCTLSVGYSPIAGTKYDVTTRLKGWTQFASDVERTLPAGTGDGQIQFISTSGRSVISELAYYLPFQPRIYRYNATDIFDSQYDVWGLPDEIFKKQAVIISAHHKPLNEELTEKYSSLKYLGSVKLASGPSHVQHIDMWLAEPKNHQSIQTASQSESKSTIEEVTIRK